MCETPSIQVVARDREERRVGAKLFSDGAMHREAALVDPVMALERDAHGFMLSRRFPAGIQRRATGIKLV